MLARLDFLHKETG